MKEILCVYYSRSGTTRSVAREIGKALNAELLELQDGVRRGGVLGYLRSGLDAMRKTPPPLLPFRTNRPLGEYRRVIVLSPVWAGRCSSPVHAFFAEYGKELPKTAIVLTHQGASDYEAAALVCDTYLAEPHDMTLSLSPKSEERHDLVYQLVRAVQAEQKDTSEGRSQ